MARSGKARSGEGELVRALLRVYGRTYAEDAGIRLTARPGPLYQLLVLTSLLGKRISADVAVAAARELFQAGLKTPQSMLDASWQERVDALGRGHYRRYDESTSRLLAEAAKHCLERWGGDLRRLRREANGDRRRLNELLTEFPDADGEAGDVKWNFEKFVVDDSGEIVGRFRSDVEPDDDAIIEVIEDNLPV